MIKGFYPIKTDEIKDVKITHNFHSHTYLCGHARGEVKDYVKEAVKNGFNKIGVSDHMKNPFNIHNPYMDMKVFYNSYLPQFTEAEKLFGDKIEILKGVEIEYGENYDDYYKELKDNLDYMVLGQHEFIYNSEVFNTFFDVKSEKTALAYLDNVSAGICSGYFKISAHLDVMFFSHFIPTDRVIYKMEEVVNLCKKKGVFLELNAQGTRYGENFSYPTDLLIEIIKKVNPKVVVSADAHSYEKLTDDNVKKLYYIAKKNGLDVF